MKLLAALLEDQLMSIAVGGDFMAAGGGFFHQLRELLTIQPRKKHVTWTLHSLKMSSKRVKFFSTCDRQSRPFGDRRGAGKIQDVEPVFDVDGKNGSLHDRPLASFRI